MRNDRPRAKIDFCADFETLTDPSIEGRTRVWAWGFLPVDSACYENVEIGLTIDTFIERVSQQPGTCYFHNLKFDAMFILDYLMNNGYAHTTEESLLENTFKTLISDQGKFFAMTVKWANGNETEFRDSLKKLPMPLRRIAESFHLDMAKGDIDYELYRAPGQPLTDEEEDYLRRDVAILGQAMKVVLDSGMRKLTVASDAMAEYKKLSGLGKFNTIFPTLSFELDRVIRHAYRGGFTYADPRFQGRLLGSGLVLDVNSLYPSVMKKFPIPYGRPDFSRGEVLPTEQRPLVIFTVTFLAKLKPNHIPCIQIKGNNLFMGTEYLREIKEPTTMTVTNVDWQLYNDHYDIEVLAWEGGLKFRANQGMFDEYIDKWTAVKISETGGKREIAKLHLNSLYGKFASNPNVTSKIPVLKDGIVKLVRGTPEQRPPVYTAAGVFITAYARDITIRAAQANYENFAYADTDSLHLLQDEPPSNITVHPSDLGAWKLEYNFQNAYYIRPKAYLELKTDGHYENRIAGLPTSISASLTFDDLVHGTVLHGKLEPMTVPGGVVLRDKPFELKLR